MCMKKYNHISTSPQKMGLISELISCIVTKTYIVGTQKNHLNEMILLCTHNICFYEEI